jgi:hypothetical protein
MKTYISDIIPKIQRYSKSLDNQTLLKGQHWVILDEIENNKSVYIFRDNNELLISTNGKVERCQWEFLGNDSLLIDRKDESYLFKHGFFDEHILALKIDSQEDFAVLINETKAEKELNSIKDLDEFLYDKYLNNSIPTIGKKHKSQDIKKDVTFGKEEYKILRTSKSWSFKTGSYIEYDIKYKNDKFGQIYHTLKEEKFSFTTQNDVKHFKDFEEAVLHLRDYVNSKD